MNNVHAIIDAFEIYVNSGNHHDLERNDKFLRFLLDHSKTPSFQGRKEVEDGETRECREYDISLMTDEQVKEVREVVSLMDGGEVARRMTAYEMEKKSHAYADYAKWDSAEELYDLILKIPPDLQETVLVIAIVIYVLRILDVNFDTDSDTFIEFYENWHKVVLASWRVTDED